MGTKNNWENLDFEVLMAQTNDQLSTYQGIFMLDILKYKRMFILDKKEIHPIRVTGFRDSDVCIVQSWL